MRLQGLEHLGDVEYVRGGGMASLYRGYSPRWGTVAIKIPRPEVRLGRFECELRIMLALGEHPNVVRTYTGQVTPLHRTSYIMMEWVPYPTLGDVIDEATPTRRFLDSPAVAAVACHVCMALHHAYRTARVRAHRDIKPNNIFVDLARDTVQGVKLADFGIASPADDHRPTRTILGRPEYMAPERLKPGGDLRIDQRSDIYSLGVVMYEALCGVPPFEADDDVTVFTNVLSGHIEPIERRCPTVDLRLASVIAACLARDPEARPPNVAALAGRLEALAGTASRCTPAEVVPNAVTATPSVETAIDAMDIPAFVAQEPAGESPVEPAPRRGLLFLGLVLAQSGFAGALAAWFGLPGNSSLRAGALASGSLLLLIGAALLGAASVSSRGRRLPQHDDRYAPIPGFDLDDGFVATNAHVVHPLAEIVFISGARAGVAVTLFDYPVTCGRDPQVDIPLPDSDYSASRVHANIVYEDGAFFLDSRGLNGTRINGSPVLEPRMLQHGDVIEMGQSLLEFRQFA